MIATAETIKDNSWLKWVGFGRSSEPETEPESQIVFSTEAVTATTVDVWEVESSFSELVELLETFRDLNNEEYMAAIAEAREDIRQGRTLTHQQLLDELGFTTEELHDEA
jgi:hypothetical protein